MRIVLVCLVVGAVIGGVLYNRSGTPDTPAPKVVAATAPANASREPSQHNWPKRALDRAAEVKKQVAAERKSNDAEK